MTSKEHELCPICEEGHLSPFSRNEDIRTRGEDNVLVSFDYSKCPVCGSELTTPTQTKVNQARIADARRAAEGLLTGADIRAFRELLGITQTEAARLFGGGPNSFSKYERGEVLQSFSMDRLIRVASEFAQILPYLSKLVTGEQPRLRIHERYRTNIFYSDEKYLARPVCKTVASIAHFRKVPSANQNENEWTNDTSIARRACDG
jgi:HTH-type transcriptional regulator / antitoxin MqsA